MASSGSCGTAQRLWPGSMFISQYLVRVRDRVRVRVRAGVRVRVRVAVVPVERDG